MRVVPLPRRDSKEGTGDMHKYAVKYNVNASARHIGRIRGNKVIQKREISFENREPPWFRRVALP